MEPTPALALAAKHLVPLPPEDDSLLFVIALVLLVGGLLAAALLARRAPAASFALIGGVTVGLWGAAFSLADGPQWVPSKVSVWVSLGVVAGGAVGVIVSGGRPADRRFLQKSGVIMLLLAPCIAFAFGQALLVACPLYSPRLTEYCYFGDSDLLGAWITGVAILFGFDMVVLAVVFFISARRASTP